MNSDVATGLLGSILVYPKDSRYSTAASSRSYAFRIHGTVCEFYPTPSSGTYRMYYAPAYTTLSIDSDTVDGVNGWEEFIVLDSAIKCLIKEGSDHDDLLRERQMMLNRVDEMGGNKKLGPFRITDVKGAYYGIDPADWLFYV